MTEGFHLLQSWWLLKPRSPVEKRQVFVRCKITQIAYPELAVILQGKGKSFALSLLLLLPRADNSYHLTFLLSKLS